MSDGERIFAVMCQIVEALIETRLVTDVKQDRQWSEVACRLIVPPLP
jgi:hypothetical protein